MVEEKDLPARKIDGVWRSGQGITCWWFRIQLCEGEGATLEALSRLKDIA
jgi:hypothetical protein